MILQVSALRNLVPEPRANLVPEPRARPQNLIGWAAAAAARAKPIDQRALEAFRDAGNYLGATYQQHIYENIKINFS